MAKVPKSPTIWPTIIMSPLPTPSPSDPDRKEAYYQALGEAIVACGRLEGHFSGCLILILQIGIHKGIKPIGTRLPRDSEERSRVWRHAFNLIPELTQHRGDALAIILEIDDHTEDRNLIAHGFWEEFRPELPLAMNITNLKNEKVQIAKGKPPENGIVSRKTSFNILELQQISKNASDLSQRLSQFSTPLSRLVAGIFQPQPPIAHKYPHRP